MIPPEKQHIADRLEKLAGTAIPSVRRKELNKLVVEFVKAIPEATARDVADYLDTHDSYVRATCQRKGLTTASVERSAYGRSLHLMKFPLDLKQRVFRKASQQGLSVQNYIIKLVQRELEC